MAEQPTIIEHRYTRNLVCPHCGQEDHESWELSDSEDNHECGSCGEHFSYERIVTVEYSSKKLKETNIANLDNFE